MLQRDNAADTDTVLQKKVKELEREVTKPMSAEELQNMILKIKKDEVGYEFPIDKYYRLMMISEGRFSSREDQMEYILKCFVKVKRGNYEGKSEEGEDEKQPKRSGRKKRKKARNRSNQKEEAGRNDRRRWKRQRM
jgi:hypothetical protein